MEAQLKNPNAVRALSTIDGIRRALEARYGVEEVAAAVGRNPLQSEADDCVALFRNIAQEYGQAMVLAELQQSSYDASMFTTVQQYKEWAVENSQAKERVKELEAELAEAQRKLGQHMGGRHNQGAHRG